MHELRLYKRRLYEQARDARLYYQSKYPEENVADAIELLETLIDRTLVGEEREHAKDVLDFIKEAAAIPCDVCHLDRESDEDGIEDEDGNAA